MKWISVKERLPENAMIVIVAGGIARYRGGVWISETSDATGREIQWEVTHWMPLPPPPDKEAGKQ